MENTGKKRADFLLCARNLCDSREMARRLILAGQVRVGSDRVIRKPSEMLVEDADLRVIQSSPYVSRGAYKLLPALQEFCPDLTGKMGLDIGASTGGFTDLMLQAGAIRVYAIDSGTGQLHGKLRQDPRVISRENCNARYLEKKDIPDEVDLLVMDVSFISVTKIIPAVSVFLKPGGFAFILVKPQFEAGREKVGKGGVVRNERIQLQCVDNVKDFVGQSLAWQFRKTMPCPIKGPKGNQEYMLVFQNP